MRLVVDTNVLASALLSPHGRPAQVLRLLLQGDLVPLHDDRILAEYRAVLSRPRFAFALEDVSAGLEGIEERGSATNLVDSSGGGFPTGTVPYWPECA
jgi:putative PIN family toxin of toxin-antitoxin system